MTSNAPTTLVPVATTVVISGASRGLGLAMAADLLKVDLRVATFARTPTSGLLELQDAFGDRFYHDSVDINDRSAVSAFLSRTAERLGPPDALINNAAVGQDSMLVQARPDHIESLIATNLTAPLLLTRDFLRTLLASGRGGAS